MEIRQLRYLVAVVEQGGMGRAARELGVVTSALSQQISRLELELSVRLLQRRGRGAVPTDAGLAFYRQAQLALRNIDGAALAAQQARLTGQVSIGLAPTTATIIGLPLVSAMRERYPGVQLRLVEALSGHLAGLLSARQLDLAILFDGAQTRHQTTQPLLDESLYMIAAPELTGTPTHSATTLAAIATLPQALPSSRHGLRRLLAQVADAQALTLNVAFEIDSLSVLVDALEAGLAASIQPGAVIRRLGRADMCVRRLGDKALRRRNSLASLPDDELSPAALAARLVVRDVVAECVSSGAWPGATLHEA